MQFKTSQRLFNFNNDGGSPKVKTAEKDGIGISMALLSPRRFFESRINQNPNQSLHLRPKDISSKVRKGLVIEVNEQYGRILCSRSFGDLGVFVFFDRNTTVNGASLCLGNVDLMSAVPLGVEIDFKVTFGFPSKWRTFGTYMGYYCESLKYDCTQHVTMFHAELLATETRHDGLVIGYDGLDGKAVIHPHIWPSPNTIRKLYSGAELEPKKNHRFQILTQQSRTLLAVVRPVPSFLKAKLRRMKYIALSAQPLSTTVVCYAYLVGIGPAELLFDSVGVRDDTGDNVPVEIVMDRNLFLSSIGLDKGQGAKVNLIGLIGQAFQLGCVRNLSTQRHPLRAFCAYLCNAGAIPRNPRVHMPRDYSRNLRKASTNLKALPSPFLEKKPSKLDTSLTHRSFYRKFYVRRSYRANPRKRAFTPCSPYTDLAAKRKNLNESMHDVSLSDF
uniref:Uncharacterized protein n=2 Tax=Panagrolaimus sp. PS1159 TaxID=55785 RepID=A0AC35FTJ0_9BILA